MFATKPRTYRNPKPVRRPRLAIQELETRSLMAASLTASLNVADGILRVEGTYSSDQVHVRHSGGAVRIDGITIAVTNGETTTPAASVPRGQISKIVVAALDGNDLVQMHDTLRAGEAAIPMVIHGGSGNDTLIGGRGADSIYGESGADSILGGAGKDLLYGDSNPAAAKVVQDYGLYVYDEFQNWYGKNEKWLLERYVGQDVFKEYYVTPDGGLYEYSTTLVSTGQFTQTDILLETLDPSYYQDLRKLETERGLYPYDLYYGTGNRDEKWLGGIGDTYFDKWYFVTPVGELSRWDGEDAADPVTGTLLATLDFAALADPYELVKAVTDDGAADILNGQDGDDYLDGGAGNDYLDGRDGNDTLSGLAGNDTLYGWNGNDSMLGGDGDDFLNGQQDHDWMNGQDGNDTLWGFTGNDTLFGWLGDDSLLGGAGKDYINGQQGNDWLNGQEDDDLIIGFDGRDSLYGWTGNDTLYGGAGDDYMDGQQNNDTMDGQEGNDTLIGNTGADWMNGSSGNDSLYGGTNNDSLYGGFGNDFLDGQEGNDTLDGQDDDDTLLGSGGHDWMNGSFGNDSLYGGFGNDSMYGGFGNDLLDGQQDNDTLDGQDDDDTLVGNNGNDSIYGGSGTDILYGNDGNDWMWGGEQADVLYGGWGKDIMAGDGGDDYLRGEGNSDTLYGNDGNDTMYGDNAGNPWGGEMGDVMYGGSGYDTLYGEGGADKLFGEDDDDSLWGGTEADTLDGGAGMDGLFGGKGWVDVLRGGTGNDRFITTQFEDVLADVQGWSVFDAVINFVDGGTAEFDDQTYTPGAWNDAEIERIDQVLNILHHATGDAQLLRTNWGRGLEFIRHGTNLRGFNNGSVHVTSGQLYDAAGDQWMRGYLLHEIGHHFEGAAGMGGFGAISGWTDEDPENGAYSVSVGQDPDDADDNWWYLTSSTFASDYAKTNLAEDFAESFSAYFTQLALLYNSTGSAWTFYNGAGAAAIPEKMSLFSRWVASL